MLRSLSPTLPSLQMGKDAETLSDYLTSPSREGRREAEKKTMVGGRGKYKIQDALKASQLPVLTNYVHGFERAGRCAPRRIDGISEKLQTMEEVSRHLR